MRLCMHTLHARLIHTPKSAKIALHPTAFLSILTTERRIDFLLPRAYNQTCFTITGGVAVTDSAVPNATSGSTIACRQCSAILTFAPGTTSLTCQYCGFKMEIAQANDTQIKEFDFDAALAQGQSSQPTSVAATITCDHCGAATSVRSDIVTDACPFCNSPVKNAQPKTESTILPHYLLPFGIDESKARGAFRQWLRKLWLAPNDLKRNAAGKAFKGVYIPFWTYDSKVDTRYIGERGVDYYTTESYTATVNGRRVTRTRQVRHTRWSPASGGVANAFDDILVAATTSLPQNKLDKLEPWDLPRCVAFDDRYLAGFRSERYRIDLRQGFEIAKVKVQPKIDDTIRRDIGGDHQRIHSRDSRYHDITFKHILLPIWMSAYAYKSRIFQFLVNARTAEVQGEWPYSVPKIVALVAAGLAVVGAVVYFYLRSQGYVY